MWEDRSYRALTTYKSQDTPSRRSCRGGRGVAHSPLHLPLVGQVRLVAHQHDDHIAAPLRPDIINPLRGLLEGVEIWRWKVGIKLGMRGGPAGEGKGSGGRACTLRHLGRAGGSTDRQVWTFLRTPGCICGTVLRAPKTPHIAEPPTGERSWHLEGHWVMICSMD